MSERRLVRWLYIRGLALILLIAVGSLWWQLHDLVGSDGIIPVDGLKVRVEAAYGQHAPLRWPSLIYAFDDVDLGLNVLCATATAAGLALLVSTPFEGPLLLIAYACFLSIVLAGNLFLTFQWDNLLCEALIAATLVARWGGRRPPPTWAWWVQWSVVCRLMFFGGLVKLTSGDPSWWDGTALTYHYWTQPMPNPLSWYAHQQPVWMHQLGVFVTFVVELLFPFFIVFGRKARAVAFLGFVGLMATLFLTGNYGYFQLLAVVCSLPLLDDDHLKWLVRLWPKPLQPKALQPTEARSSVHYGLVLAIPLTLLAVMKVPERDSLPKPAQEVLYYSAPYKIVNSYGLFARMTKKRPELVFSATEDGKTWIELPMNYMAGDVYRTPTQIAPHMPRLQWRLWFAALGSCKKNRWVPTLMQQMADAHPGARRLLRYDPFDGRPVSAVRVERYQYHFAPPGSDQVWERNLQDRYCPDVGVLSP